MTGATGWPRLMGYYLIAGVIGASAVTSAEGDRPLRGRVADMVLLDGKIVTLDGDDRIVPALAIADGRILAVGENEAMRAWVGPQTRVIRLDGKTVIPGIIETHCHAVGVGRGALVQPYAELSSIAEIQQWIRNMASQRAPGRWIRVPRTDLTRLKERRHPTVAELDAACTTHPVILTAARKHVLNSLGFQRLEISSDDPSVPGGEVLLDGRGELRMIAGGDGYLRQRIGQPTFTNEQSLAALKKVLAAYNQVGITSIFERAISLDDFRLYQRLREQDQLTVRMTATFRQQFRSGEEVEPFVKRLGMRSGDGDDWIRVGPLKITVDGGIHWGNTFLSERYGQKRIRFYVLKDPAYRGDRRYSVDQMRSIFEAGHRLGWQMCCHVTGDAGVDSVLDALEAVDQKIPLRERRFTLVHCYFPSLNAIQRAKRLGICVDTQCYLYYKDAAAIHEVYGPSWAERFIGVGDWLRGGVPVAINSDHMIGLDPHHAMNAFHPFLQMYIAISRKNERGEVYGARQRISRKQALRCMTANAAYLSFDEQRKGSLQVGMLADLAILDRDFLTCPEAEIPEIQVLLTLVDGRVVFQRPGLRAGEVPGENQRH